MAIVYRLKRLWASGAQKYAKLPLAAVMVTLCAGGGYAQASVPPPPSPEPISVTELPLPPTAPSDTAGSCTAAINPHNTGCMSAASTALTGGSFLPDDRAVLAYVTFAGAPASGPVSIYTGAQVILVKTDGTTFSNGDAWKCLTCGVPPANAISPNAVTDGVYPQSFPDGMRAMYYSNIIDCSPYPLDSDQCTPQALHIYPIRWGTSADGSGGGAYIRELRIHPDGVHIGFNTYGKNQAGNFSEWGLFGRLVFDPSPKTGLPLAPRYDIENVSTLLPSTLSAQEVITQVPGHPTQLMTNHNAITVGEFRGFSKDGTEAFYIGYPWESDNIDVFAVNLSTGAVRRMTNNPGYVDPVDASPDDQWIVMDETYPSTRMQFMSAMRNVPPLNDMITSAFVSSVRNNYQRRFFEPILLDRYGERGTYQGQQINAGSTAPGGIDDPNWNSLADPRWSWDGTEIMYFQNMVVSPACGGVNPLPCPVSTEPGGRETRLMLAKLTSRTPYHYVPPAPVSDTVPWATPYVPGNALPVHAELPPGTYTLPGQNKGSATVQIIDNAAKTGIVQVNVTYRNYSDDGVTTLNGQESAFVTYPSITLVKVHWTSAITQSGYDTKAITGGGTKTFFFVNKKTTSAGGATMTEDLLNTIFEATGTLSSMVNGVLYTQPANGT